MKLIYEFELIVESLPDAAVEALAVCIIERTGDGPDVTPVGDEQGGLLQFYREADSAAAAMMMAIEDARAAGLSVVGVDSGDLVSQEEIATRARVTIHAVRHWAHGVRGPGGFPRPEKARLYSWEKVAAWLLANRFGNVDHSAREVAQAAVFFNAVLTAKRTREAVPDELRERALRLATC